MLARSTLLQRRIGLAPFTTLRAGGPAEYFLVAYDVDGLAGALAAARAVDAAKVTVLGWGSNVLPSDRLVPGLVAVNLASQITVRQDGFVEADCGCGFQDLFLKTAQAGLGGLEYAVGIPGTLGGALVSNAGAYRSSVSEFLTELEVATPEGRQWVHPTWMRFSYRDSLLRSPDAPNAVLLRVRMRLPRRNPKDIYDEAREYQRQRISKQPPPASAGSFFKNVNDFDLASRLETLPPKIREAGVVPAGYLLEGAGLKGFRMGGAMFGSRHANFMLNVGKASASNIRRLAEYARSIVFEKYGVLLEEEVLYLGDWSSWDRE